MRQNRSEDCFHERIEQVSDLQKGVPFFKICDQRSLYAKWRYGRILTPRPRDGLPPGSSDAIWIFWAACSAAATKMLYGALQCIVFTSCVYIQLRHQAQIHHRGYIFPTGLMQKFLRQALLSTTLARQFLDCDALWYTGQGTLLFIMAPGLIS